MAEHKVRKDAFLERGHLALGLAAAALPLPFRLGLVEVEAWRFPQTVAI